MANPRITNKSACDRIGNLVPNHRTQAHTKAVTAWAAESGILFFLRRDLLRSDVIALLLIDAIRLDLFL